MALTNVPLEESHYVFLLNLGVLSIAQLFGLPL
jgi:hypothetical protein